MVTNLQPPVGGDTSNVVPGLVGMSFFLAITLIVYGFRIYTRVHPTFQLTAADYILSAALLCELAVFISQMIAIHLGLGRYDYYLSPTASINILKSLFPVGLLGFWASSLARVSIGSMLLRFEISTVWRVMLWVLILIQLALAIGADIFQLLQCRPIRALWEPVPDAVCWTPRTSQSFSYIHSGIGITSDIVFAIMPAFFIWSLPRPVLERTLVSILMALGMIAAVAGIMKLHTIRVWNPREVTLRDWVPLLWWYRVEEIGLIAAACAPFLKPPIERVLGRFGVTKFGFITISLPTIRSFQGGSAKDSSKEESSV